MSALYADSERKIAWGAIFVGLTAAIGGLWLGIALFDALPLDPLLREEARPPSGKIFLVLPIFLIILAAHPGAPRQYGWFTGIVLLLSVWVFIAGDFAVTVQHYVWPSRDYLVNIFVFTLLAGPATALCLVAMKRLGIVPAIGARAFMLRLLALSIPGFLVTGMVVDLIDAAGLLADGADLVSQQLWIPVLSAGVVGFWGARPVRRGHDVILCFVLAIAMSGGVAGQAMLYGYTWYAGTDLLGTIVNTVVVLIVISAQFGLVHVARALSGPGGPWPEAEGRTRE